MDGGDTDRGGVSQEVSRQHIEHIQGPARHAHEHEHHRGGQPVVTAELLPDGRHVRRRESEELLPVEINQARRQGLLADQAPGEGEHDIYYRSGRCAVNVPPRMSPRQSADHPEGMEAAWNPHAY